MEYHYWWTAGLAAPHIGTIIGAFIYSLTVGMHNTKDDSNASLSTLVTVPITKNDIIYERGNAFTLFQKFIYKLNVTENQYPLNFIG